MSRPQDSRLPYLPGIDALRAIAVLAVFLYHAGVGWMPGGFLGVDVFFAISGYLITSLLLSERRRTGRVRLGQFWLRRARRLLPAVGVLIAVTMIVAAIVEPDRLTELRGDAISSLAYVANWHFIFAHQSYFDQFQRPSLFRHLWSLSVEEQFYLFWPLAFAAGMSLLGRKRLALGVLAGAVASLALMWVLFDPTDASRVYYGTETHAAGLLIGVALALVWAPWQLRRATPGRWCGPMLDAVGVLALGYLALSFLQVHDYDLALYHGGYLWIALASAAVIAVFAHPAARLGGLVAQPPLVWLGLRSYSFYLWHWPVLALTRPGLDISLPRGVLIPLQLLVVLALADLSYRFVELPFRGKRKIFSLPDGWLRVGRPALAFAVVAIVALVGWSGIFSSGSEPNVAAASTAEFAKVTVKPESPRRAIADRGRRHASDQPHGKPPRIVAFGDSVMIGAKEKLAARFGRRFSMNAKVGRQADEFVSLARRLKQRGGHIDALIIQMGNNGPLYGDEMEALRKATSNVGELFLIDDHAPVSWQDESNHALEEADETWPHTTLIDWAPVAAAHENLLWDGIHLTPGGAGIYTRLIVSSLQAANVLSDDASSVPPRKARDR
ncbi:MAG TPA: acyltransferase family protein [Solirubrobacterales bacterium]|jgi:peptidoglycan/LPS O-acetylase OafA/YrhL|nr:acyltransferase family protein [Solirubrobacterales bacterium]